MFSFSNSFIFYIPTYCILCIYTKHSKGGVGVYGCIQHMSMARAKCSLREEIPRANTGHPCLPLSFSGSKKISALLI